MCWVVGIRRGCRGLWKRDRRGTSMLASLFAVATSPRTVAFTLLKYTHRDPAFIPPKKPYSFDAMLSDILHFASESLVDDGRLAFWMPTANTSSDDTPSKDSPPTRSPSKGYPSRGGDPREDHLRADDPRDSSPEPTSNNEHPIPTHPCLALVNVCIQPFNRWSRRLLTYRKLPDERVDPTELEAWLVAQRAVLEEAGGVTADELNPFRKGYFSKFVKEMPPEG